MDIIPITKNIYLTSQNATNGSLMSSFHCNITDILNNEHVQYSTIRVTTAEVPVSFYIINEYNNKLSIDNVIYEFPFGNYNANTFIDYFVGLLPTFTLSINRSTGKFVMGSTSNFTVNYIGSTMCDIIGFTTDLTSSGNSLIFTNPCNFSGNKNVTIHTNLHLNSIETSKNLGTIIGKIPNNVSPYETIFYSNKSQSSQLIRDLTLTDMKIELRGDNNQLLNFNGQASSIEIEVTQYIKFFTNIKFN